MRIWNPKTAEVIHVVRGHPYHSEGIACLTISSDSALVLMGSSDGSVHVNISTGKVVTSLTAHSVSVECAAFEASSRRDSWRVATGGMAKKKLIIWDQNSSPRCICDHEEEVTCLMWLSGCRYVASGCLDGKVRIWDSLSGDCAKVVSGHSDAMQSISASSFWYRFHWMEPLACLRLRRFEVNRRGGVA